MTPQRQVGIVLDVAAVLVAGIAINYALGWTLSAWRAAVTAAGLVWAMKMAAKSAIDCQERR